MSTEDRWEPRIAAERLAQYHANVLDYVGRVDQAVTDGDLWYLIDKGRTLAAAVDKLVGLAEELNDEQTPLQPHLPAIKSHLVRTGAQGYRVIAALHPVIPVQVTPSSAGYGVKPVSS